MATSEQIRALIASYGDGDERRFFAVAAQIAAQAAMHGHGKLADEIRQILEEIRLKKNRATPAIRTELGGLLAARIPKNRLSDLVLDQSIRLRLERVLLEQRQQNKIREYGLRPRNKLLFVGPPGSGKTLTASALAGEMKLPIFTIQLDTLITKFMGETAAKLRLVFDAIGKERGVYFFDEVDAIAGRRNVGNDVGEIRRVLNSFLQFIEQNESESLIIAATNHPEMLDYALFRRFDDVIEYSLPSTQLALELFKSRLASMNTQEVDWDEVLAHSKALSFADIVTACDDSIKDSILSGHKAIGTDLIVQNITRRQRKL